MISNLHDCMQPIICQKHISSRTLDFSQTLRLNIFLDYEVHNFEIL
jgi:hypothetical protein